MADGDLISRASLLAAVAELKESPWYNFGKVDGTSLEGMEALKDTSVSVDVDTVKLRKGVKKFRAENYVIYDVNFLLENLAREITLLYQTGKDFSESTLNIDNIRRMFVDYAPCEECTNPYTWGHICVKCGARGRKFDDKGVLIDDE